jgi:hypothetical protein
MLTSNLYWWWVILLQWCKHKVHVAEHCIHQHQLLKQQRHQNM